jgi:hypothetical protein
MVLKVTAKKRGGGSFTQCQLDEIAASLRIVLPDAMRLVSYGQAPPLDTTLVWQPTNGSESPVGKVKTFQDGEWK